METLEEKIAKFLAINTGSGSGSGDGSGSGSGDGDGITIFNGHKVYYIDGIPTLIYSVVRGLVKGAVVNGDFTLKECYVAKVGNYFGHGETAHEAYAAAESKALENEPIENRVKKFVAKYPDFDKKIPAQELFEWHHILTGSCEFGRRQFAEQHGINLKTDSFTVNEFVELTKESYGGENIKLLIKQS